MIIKFKLNKLEEDNYIIRNLYVWFIHLKDIKNYRKFCFIYKIFYNFKRTIFLNKQNKI